MSRSGESGISGGVYKPRSEESGISGGVYKPRQDLEMSFVGNNNERKHSPPPAYTATVNGIPEDKIQKSEISKENAAVPFKAGEKGGEDEVATKPEKPAVVGTIEMVSRSLLMKYIRMIFTITNI